MQILQLLLLVAAAALEFLVLALRALLAGQVALWAAAAVLVVEMAEIMLLGARMAARPVHTQVRILEVLYALFGLERALLVPFLLRIRGTFNEFLY